MNVARWAVIGFVAVGGAALGQATQIDDSWLVGLRNAITNENPQVKADRVDHERLTARRVDIVDRSGLVRMTLAGDAPNPIVDGLEYRRSIPYAGLLIYDDKGNERGGLGFNPARRSTQLTMDFAASDAVSVASREDGTTELLMNARPREFRHPTYGDRRLPLAQGKTRLRMRLAADGTPEIALADRQEKTRLRLTVTAEGHGAIEFLNADGQVVSTLAPERTASATR